MECVRLAKWHQYILSVSLKFGAYNITGQWEEFIKNCYLMLSCAFLAFFVVFHYKICVFIIFISFFDEVSNFRNRILTNQKRELAVSNCQWNLCLFCWQKQTVDQTFLRFLLLAFFLVLAFSFLATNAQLMTYSNNIWQYL